MAGIAEYLKFQHKYIRVDMQSEICSLSVMSLLDLLTLKVQLSTVSRGFVFCWNSLLQRLPDAIKMLQHLNLHFWPGPPKLSLPDFLKVNLPRMEYTHSLSTSSTDSRYALKPSDVSMRTSFTGDVADFAGSLASDPLASSLDATDKAYSQPAFPKSFMIQVKTTVHKNGKASACLVDPAIVVNLLVLNCSECFS